MGEADTGLNKSTNQVSLIVAAGTSISFGALNRSVLLEKGLYDKINQLYDCASNTTDPQLQNPQFRQTHYGPKFNTRSNIAAWQKYFKTHYVAFSQDNSALYKCLHNARYQLFNILYSVSLVPHACFDSLYMNINELFFDKTMPGLKQKYMKSMSVVFFLIRAIGSINSVFSSKKKTETAVQAGGGQIIGGEKIIGGGQIIGGGNILNITEESILSRLRMFYDIEKTLLYQGEAKYITECAQRVLTSSIGSSIADITKFGPLYTHAESKYALIITLIAMTDIANRNKPVDKIISFKPSLVSKKRVLNKLITIYDGMYDYFERTELKFLLPDGLYVVTFSNLLDLTIQTIKRNGQTLYQESPNPPQPSCINIPDNTAWDIISGQALVKTLMSLEKKVNEIITGYLKTAPPFPTQQKKTGGFRPPTTATTATTEGGGLGVQTIMKRANNYVSRASNMIGAFNPFLQSMESMFYTCYDMFTFRLTIEMKYMITNPQIAPNNQVPYEDNVIDFIGTLTKYILIMPNIVCHGITTHIIKSFTHGMVKSPHCMKLQHLYGIVFDRAFALNEQAHKEKKAALALQK